MQKRLFFLILILAAVLRFWNLGTVPPGPNWDEAALGYNAYSILNTGKDEYGISFPLSLRSFDDYKPPLYMYLAVPSVALFDLNVWSVRLPAVLVGLFAVIGVFLVTREFIQYSAKKKEWQYIPLLAMFVFSISPWHLQFSRMAFEAGIGVAIIIWAVVTFLWGLRSPRVLSISAFLFGLSLYAYHSQRVFAPLLCMVLAAVFFKQLRSQWKTLFLPVAIGVITIAPLIPVFTDATTLTRLRGTSALSDQTRLLERSVIKLERNREQGNLLGLVFDNRRVVFVQTLLEGYLSHFSPGWLFVRGDNARHHAPGMGLLYHIELPFFLIGLYLLAKHGKKMMVVVLGWMLIAPIAASPTTELPHAIRTLVFLPTFQIVIAVGIWHVYQQVLSKPLFIRYGVLAGMLCLWCLNVGYYLTMYHLHQNREYSRFWQYGYKDAVEYAKEHYSKYDSIVVSTALEQPHMFFLFYLRYDPRQYLSEGGTASGGFKEVRNRFDKFVFRPIRWNEESRSGRILYIGSPTEIPEANLKTIYYLNGEEAMRIAQ